MNTRTEFYENVQNSKTNSNEEEKKVKAPIPRPRSFKNTETQHVHKNTHTFDTVQPDKTVIEEGSLPELPESKKKIESGRRLDRVVMPHKETERTITQTGLYGNDGIIITEQLYDKPEDDIEHIQNRPLTEVPYGFFNFKSV